MIYTLIAAFIAIAVAAVVVIVGAAAALVYKLIKDLEE